MLGLFERHKLMFSMQMCIKIEEGRGAAEPRAARLFLEGEPELGEVQAEETVRVWPEQGWRISCASSSSDSEDEESSQGGSTPEGGNARGRDPRGGQPGEEPEERRRGRRARRGGARRRGAGSRSRGGTPQPRKRTAAKSPRCSSTRKFSTRSPRSPQSPRSSAEPEIQYRVSITLFHPRSEEDAETPGEGGEELAETPEEGGDALDESLEEVVEEKPDDGGEAGAETVEVGRRSSRGRRRRKAARLDHRQLRNRRGETPDAGAVAASFEVAAPKVNPFKTLADHIEAYVADWRAWYDLEAPEQSADARRVLGDAGHLRADACLLRCVRVDRVTVAVTRYVIDSQWASVVRPAARTWTTREDLRHVQRAHARWCSCSRPARTRRSTCSGSASALGVPARGLEGLKYMALGQGMGPKAAEMLEMGSARGLWVMLAELPPAAHAG